MHINNIFEAIGKIDDELIHASIETPTKKQAVTSHWLIRTAAILIIIAVSFSTALTVNAQFRKWVISLFQIQEVEHVPLSEQTKISPSKSIKSSNTSNGQSHISIFATNTIEDLFKVQYLESDHFMDTIGPLFYYTDDFASNKYFAAEKGSFIPVKTQNIKRNVKLLGVSGKIDYTQIKYDSELFLIEKNRNRFLLNNEDEAEFDLSVEDNNEVWLWLNINPQSDVWVYPAKYDLSTGKTFDILHGIQINGKALSDYHYLNNWRILGNGRFIVSLGQSQSDSNVYLIDSGTKHATSLSSITGLASVMGIKVFDDQLILMERCPEAITNHYTKIYSGGGYGDEYFNYYRYDLTTGKLTMLLKYAKNWSSCEQGGGCIRVGFLDDGYDFIEDNDSIYLLDDLTGKHMTVEGITMELAENSAINSDGSKILVSSYSENSMWQLGVIDIKAEKLYLWNRKNQEGIQESSIGWNNQNCIVINASNDISGKSYVYLYSLIK